MFVNVEAGERTWRELYGLFVGIVTPRPIAFVSSVSAAGVQNLAPFSWYNMVSANPPVLMFVPSVRRDGGAKDTLANIRATGEFVVAAVSAEICDPMVKCAADLPAEQSEFEYSGLTPAPARVVKASLVAEAPANFECRLRDVITLSSEPGGGNIVLGDIVAVHVRDDVLGPDGVPDPEKLHAVGRLGRNEYTTVSAPYSRVVPKV